ncbi:MAG TPA: hypothetical protein VLR94_03385, partial [Acidobacteriota bacterium]|nr:hypothetical protein [Acidobacteriota bacterium]
GDEEEIRGTNKRKNKIKEEHLPRPLVISCPLFLHICVPHCIEKRIVVQKKYTERRQIRTPLEEAGIGI